LEGKLTRTKGFHFRAGVVLFWGGEKGFEKREKPSETFKYPKKKVRRVPGQPYFKSEKRRKCGIRMTTDRLEEYHFRNTSPQLRRRKKDVRKER